MTNMAFGVPQVREFLAANGHVLTVRGYDYRTGSATVADLNNIRIKRTKVCEIKTSADLGGFLPLSGFATVGEWWIQIRRFCKGRMWLYRVEIDNDHISRMERDYEKRERTKIPPLAEEIEIHPFDERDNQRRDDAFMVDLQPYRDAAHADAVQVEQRRAERKREQMRKKYEERHDPCFVPKRRH